MTHFLQPLDLTVNREAQTFMKDQWDVSVYNYLASSEGRQSIAKGWKKAGETDVVSGAKKLPPEYPFEDLDVKEHCGL